MSREITIEVTRTIQVRQYEPVTVRVAETITVKDSEVKESRKELYAEVTRAVKGFIDNERIKYEAEDEKRSKKK